jgi:hypothetical protein
MSFKIKLFSYHLLISIVLAIISTFIVFFIWHPFPLAKAVGVTHIFIMMLLIDTILGPLLTLLIAKKGKPSLRYDLTIIFILQLGALFYGMYNIASSRPVWIVFDSMRFDLVQANDIPKELLPLSKQPFNKLPLLSQNWAAVRVAKSDKEKSDRTFWELEQGVAPSMMPNLYTPLIHYQTKIQQQALPLEQLNSYNSNLSIIQVLNKHPQATAWLPLKANAVDMVVLINKEKGEVVKIVDLRPWK